MNKLSVDIIIPTYNRESTLNRAIESVLNQSYKHFHLYIIDDGSTDKTFEIASKYNQNEQVSYVYQENVGVSAARNAGVNLGINPWVSFLDSDDEWLPNKLMKQIEFIQNNPNISFVHTDEIWIRNGVRVNPKIKHAKSDDLKTRSLEFCIISPSTVMIKKDLFNRFNGFNLMFPVCEDFDLWNKILAFEEIGFLNESLINKYGGHEDQLSTKFKAMDYWRIKSLFDLFNFNGIDQFHKELISKMIIKKAEILLKSYEKYHNPEHFEEISKIRSLIYQKGK